jgi:SAM-dependent methyltransferase
MSRPGKLIKRGVARVLGQVGLLPAATDLYLWLRSVPTEDRDRGDDASGGVALPTPALRLSAAGTTDVDWFLRSGRAGAEVVQDLTHLLPSRDRPVSILDFGCGCGRVLRHLGSLEAAQLFGVDWNPRAIRWCHRNLPGAEFAQGGLAPPLPFGDRFDIVYAFSVFTHLPAELQVAWLREISERLHPEGLLALSTHGDAFATNLVGEEVELYRAGQLVVREPTVAGTNVCASYHPPGSLAKLLPPGLEIVRHEPGGARGNPPQDLWVLRKRQVATH